MPRAPSQLGPIRNFGKTPPEPILKRFPLPLLELPPKIRELVEEVELLSLGQRVRGLAFDDLGQNGPISVKGGGH